MAESNLSDLFASSMSTFWAQSAEYIPRVFGALALFIFGWLVAWALGRALRLVLRTTRFNELCRKVGAEEWLKAIRIEAEPSELMGRLFFWGVFLLFITSISTTLGLTRLSETIQAAVLFLPHLFLAALLFALGAGLARFVSRAAKVGLDRIGFAQSRSFATLLHGFLIILAGIIALEQIDVQTQFVFYVLMVLLSSAGLALALTIGLGTRSISGQIVAGIYSRDQIKPGTRVTVDGREGILERVGPTTTTLRDDDGGRWLIPNDELLRQTVRVTENKV